jgi:hypothetical protein
LPRREHGRTTWRLDSLHLLGVLTTSSQPGRVEAIESGAHGPRPEGAPAPMLHQRACVQGLLYRPWLGGDELITQLEKESTLWFEVRWSDGRIRSNFPARLHDHARATVMSGNYCIDTVPQDDEAVRFSASEQAKGTYLPLKLIHQPASVQICKAHPLDQLFDAESTHGWFPTPSIALDQLVSFNIFHRRMGATHDLLPSLIEALERCREALGSK